MKENKRSELRLGDLWEIFKSCWIVVLVAAVLATGGALLMWKRLHVPTYAAKTTMWSLRAPTADMLSSQDVAIGGALSNDYCILIMDDSVVAEVIKRVGGIENNSKNIEMLKGMATVENEPETRVLYLTVTDPSPKRATEIANTWSEVFCEMINANVGKDETDLVRIFSKAQVPDEPSNEIALWNFGLIGAAVALIVYLIFLVYFLLNDKLTTPKDIEYYLELNVLGAIPDYNGENKRTSAAAKT